MTNALVDSHFEFYKCQIKQDLHHNVKQIKWRLMLIFKGVDFWMTLLCCKIPAVQTVQIDMNATEDAVFSQTKQNTKGWESTDHKTNSGTKN